MRSLFGSNAEGGGGKAPAAGGFKYPPLGSERLSFRLIVMFVFGAMVWTEAKYVFPSITASTLRLYDLPGLRPWVKKVPLDSTRMPTGVRTPGAAFTGSICTSTLPMGRF
jgi:hypothetical protein